MYIWIGTSGESCQAVKVGRSGRQLSCELYRRSRRLSFLRSDNWVDPSPVRMDEADAGRREYTGLSVELNSSRVATTMRSNFLIILALTDRFHLRHCWWG